MPNLICKKGLLCAKMFMKMGHNLQSRSKDGYPPFIKEPSPVFNLCILKYEIL